eukprot:2832214-Prymnesium_polylepis.1
MPTSTARAPTRSHGVASSGVASPDLRACAREPLCVWPHPGTAPRRCASRRPGVRFRRPLPPRAPRFRHPSRAARPRRTADNSALSGVTLDYGPFAFMEKFAPMYNPWVGGGVPYCFARQPQAAAVNLAGLSAAFAELMQARFLWTP